MTVRNKHVYGQEPPPPLLYRLWSASFTVGRAFGVAVRVHWSMLLVFLVTWSGFEKWLPSGEALPWAVVWFVVSTFLIWTHEMGHVWAGRSLGIPTREITIWPLGGLAHMQGEAPNPRAEIFIAVAGPLTHAIWFVLAGAPYLFFVQGSPAEQETWARMLQLFLATNALLLFFNILPFWPMDGGRVTRGLLAFRTHPNHASMLTAWVGLSGAVILGLVGVVMFIQGGSQGPMTRLGGPVLIGIALSNFSACRRLLFEARWTENPYGEPEEPWRRSIPQASWSMEDPTPAEPVAVEERRPPERRGAVAAETARRRETPRQAPARPLQERIDELLDRINEVGGIENLPEDERRELREASEKLKKDHRN